MDELEKQFSGKLIKKAVVLEKIGDSWKVRSNSLCKCNKPGVWILYGKTKKGSRVIFPLEVGQTDVIANEICRDIGYIVRDYNYKIISEDKRPKQFKWSTQLYITEDSRDLDKYKDIAHKYEYLYFNAYVDQEENSRREERQNLEIALAVSSKALYWYGFGKEKTRALDLAKKTYPDLYI